MSFEPYRSPRAVESAIKDAAKRAVKEDPTLTVSDRIRQEYFHRFLSRIFASGQSEWVLKGGVGILARIQKARATTDIDLFRKSLTFDSAVRELNSLAQYDLGDFFTFVLVSSRKGFVGHHQPGLRGGQVAFDVYIGQSLKGRLNIDLVTEAVVTGEVVPITPMNALALPKLVSNEYRVYPVVDQVADKVCATFEMHGGGSSTREWDLVDLVLFAINENVNGNKLTWALLAESQVRNLVLPMNFRVPSSWGGTFKAVATKVPDCREYSDVNAAEDLVEKFVGPALRDDVADKTWYSKQLMWSEGDLTGLLCKDGIDIRAKEQIDELRGNECGYG